MEWLVANWDQISKLIVDFTAAITALAVAVVGLSSILIKFLPVLKKDSPALPVVKLLGKLSLNRCVTDAERPV